MNTKEDVCKKIILSIFSLLVLCRTAGAQDSQKATLTAADAGTCAATSTACLVINIPSGSGGATFNIGANASANTVQFEASADYGTTWVALSVFPSNSTTSVTSTTSTGAWQANVAGYTKVRMRCSTFVGGTTTTYINLSTASARSSGGGGANDPACTAAGQTAHGGVCAVQATSAGWTPTVGQDYCRADSTIKNYVCSIDGAAETPEPMFAAVPAGSKCLQSSGVAGLIAEATTACTGTPALSALTAAGASNTIANVNNPQIWNWAQTTDSQAGITFGETSAATAGTLTNGLANQAEHSISTATNSTATPLNITQGSITNTVATPLAQFQSTWNNSGLHARGFGISITNTASNADSLPFYINVGNSTLFGADKTGMGIFSGNATQASAPPTSAAANAGWKYCMYQNANCVAINAGLSEYHTMNLGGNAWLELSNANPANNGGSTGPDTNAGFSFHNAVFMMMGKGHAGCGFTNVTASEFICGNSSTNEFSAATGGSSSLGMLVRTQPGAIRSTGKTGAVTTETTCAASAGACNQAGQYHIHFTAYQGGTACTTNTTGGITPTLTWTDGNGTAHTTVGVPMETNSSLVALSGTMLFNQTGSAIGTVFASGDMNIDTNGTIIQDAVGFAQCSVSGTATYFYDFAVTRLQ